MMARLVVPLMNVVVVFVLKIIVAIQRLVLIMIVNATLIKSNVPIIKVALSEKLFHQAIRQNVGLLKNVNLNTSIGIQENAQCHSHKKFCYFLSY